MKNTPDNTLQGQRCAKTSCKQEKTRTQTEKKETRFESIINGKRRDPQNKEEKT